MKRTVFLVLALAIGSSAIAQEIETVFGGTRSSGGYGALTNKFTRINGQFANLTGIYGGWYINHKFLIGISAAALTNDLRVPDKYSVLPGERMSYEYGQVGMFNEYNFGSNKAIHFGLDLFTGAGFTVQYKRYAWNENDFDNSHHKQEENWFFVLEPGAHVEINLTRWMRFTPGVSYRLPYGSSAAGLKDADIRDLNYNVSLKFGKF